MPIRTPNFDEAPIKPHELMDINPEEYADLYQRSFTEMAIPIRLQYSLDFKHARLHRKEPFTRQKQRIVQAVGSTHTAIGAGVAAVGTYTGTSFPVIFGSILSGIGLGRLGVAYMRSQSRFDRRHKKIGEQVAKQDRKLEQLFEKGLDHHLDLVLALELSNLLRKVDGKHKIETEQKAVSKFVEAIESFAILASNVATVELDTSIIILSKIQEVQKNLIAKLRESNRSNLAKQSVLTPLTDSFASVSQRLNNLINANNGVVQLKSHLPTFEEFAAIAETHTQSVVPMTESNTRLSGDPRIGEEEVEVQEVRKSGQDRPRNHPLKNPDRREITSNDEHPEAEIIFMHEFRPQQD